MNDAIVQEFDFSNYISAASENPGHDSHAREEAELDIFADFQQASSSASSSMAMNLDTQEALLSHYSAGQTQDQQQNNSQSHQLQQHLLQRGGAQQNPNIITNEMLELKGRLEQQFKLQQLQQLILQQQMELLSGSTQGSASQVLQQHNSSQSKEEVFNGLLTPGPSGQLPAMIPKDLVSPMMGMYLNSPTNSLQSQPNVQINPSFSAPAALAFPNHNFPLPNHDFSPLISPMIHPYGSGNENTEMGSSLLHMHASNQTMQPTAHHNMASRPPSRPRLKRTGSVDDHDQPARKRVLRATPSSSVSTPGFGGNYIVPSNDSPSPVDLSMPPPVGTNNSPVARSEAELMPSGSTHASIAPMTPATMLNLRRKSIGLEPSSVPSNYPPDSKDGTSTKRPAKAKAPSVTTSSSSGPSRGRRGSATKAAFSPTLKPLLPGAQPPTPTSPLSLPVNAPPRKSSHKVAEQKRRDSLKTSFDELRFLLPPVALPEDEELLPGCMPPRGPPKGDADGPNRGVSKLALLRCGNAYIKELKGMVKRRDVEIQSLRNEVKRLRALAARMETDQNQSEAKIDLERDVDEGRSVEAGIRLTMRSHNSVASSSTGAGDEPDEDD